MPIFRKQYVIFCANHTGWRKALANSVLVNGSGRASGKKRA
jgi:hypothetical protein